MYDCPLIDVRRGVALASKGAEEAEAEAVAAVAAVVAAAETCSEEEDEGCGAFLSNLVPLGSNSKTTPSMTTSPMLSPRRMDDEPAVLRLTAAAAAAADWAFAFALALASALAACVAAIAARRAGSLGCVRCANEVRVSGT